MLINAILVVVAAVLAVLLARARIHVATLTVQLDNEQSNSGEKIRLLIDAKEKLAAQFSEHGEAALSQLLSPFGAQMEAFKKEIAAAHSTDVQQRAALQREIRMTFELNQTLAKGAEQLARALKGSTKTQGNWGELVLETVLEASGLRRGHE